MSCARVARCWRSVVSRTAVALLLALLLPGCVANKYINNRAGDLADILRGHLMFGPGIGVKGEATRVIHGGVLYTHRTFAAGLHNRAVGTWRESLFSWGVVAGHHSERALERVPFVSGSYGWAFGSGEGGGVFEPSPHAGALDLLTFRGTAMLVLGIDIEVRVGELLDFLAGLAQFDPSDDDYHGFVPEPVFVEEAPPA